MNAITSEPGGAARLARPVAPAATAAGPPVRVVHAAVAGRVRLRAAAIKGAPDVAAALAQRLGGYNGVLAVEASALTGSVLVHFRSPLTTAGLYTLVNELLSGAESIEAPSAPPADTPPADTPPWHTLSADVVAARTATSLGNGLGAAAAAERLRTAPNRLPRPKQRSSLAVLAGQFTGLPVALLAASAAISIATGGVLDAVVIAGVVVANAAIGYATESEAIRTIEALNAPVRARVRVLRDGAPVEIALEDVVCGDVQILEPGSFVAADARVIHAAGLTVDESALTGESMPVLKLAAALPRIDTPLALRANMIYRGTALTGGSGLAIVVATGAATEIGRIQALIGNTAPPTTPMEVELGRLGRQLAGVCLGVCGLMLGLGLARGEGFLSILKTAISLAVAAVPEGLPTIATTTLALGIRDMRRRNVLVRRFDAVEALGAVQFVCFDKTGTLTENKMAVRALCCGGRTLRLSDGRLRCGDRPIDVPADGDLCALLATAVLCNETAIGDGPNGVVLDGSPTEAALVRCALESGIDATGLRRRHPLTATVYRTEAQAVMRTRHRRDGEPHGLNAVKGSPAAVLRLCAWQRRAGARVPLSARARRRIEEDNERLAGQGLRVLGFAQGEAGDAAADDDDLTWLGLIGLADPVRAGMPALMQTFHRAGIATVMITGDQSATAYAVAKELGLSRDARIEILDSVRLEDLDPDVLSALAQRAHVFSRVSPRHKLLIVQALQRARKVVAMTGDGVNDGPALRAADIGVAMGRAGTDVARDVADVVLADDDPASIAEAIRRGRVIFANIRKALRFLLATNLSEIVVACAGVAAGTGSPLSPMQLLWINLLSDVFPALALAIEPAETDVMAAAPHAAGEAILRRQDLLRIAGEAAAISAGPLAACLYARRRGATPERLRTMAFESLVAAQLLHAWSCRTERPLLFGGAPLAPNPALRWALLGSFAVQGAAWLSPPVRRLLGLVPLGRGEALVTIAAGLVPLLVNEAAKMGRRQRGDIHHSQPAAGTP